MLDARDEQDGAGRSKGVEECRIDGAAALGRGVTGRPGADESLGRSEKVCRALLEASPMGVLLHRGGAILYANSACARVFGYENSVELQDSSISELVQDRHRDQVAEAVRRQESGGPAPGEFEVVGVRRDGSEVPLLVQTASIDLADGPASLAFLGDLTSQKATEKQLLRAERLEVAGRIAGQVAHDFNNLLGPLMTYPEMIKMQLPRKHPARQYCDDILQAAQQLADINQDMMALGRRGQFNPEPTDLHRLVRRAVSLCLAGAKGIEVELDLPSEVLPVAGWTSQLLRALTNLLSNAQEAMPDGGTIRVKTENVYLEGLPSGQPPLERGEYVHLSVADTGPGIPGEIRGQIFDAFFTTKRGSERRGCGLGLTVIKAILEDHRGCIDLASEEEEGTTFHLYLPVSREELQQERILEPVVGGDETILVVDDDPVQRQVIGRILGMLGYGVIVAEAGQQAVEILRAGAADLVILDMIMPPGIDGAETYRQMAELRPGQKAIILSGFAETEQVAQARELGVGAYLRKPVGLEALAETVRAALDRG